MKIYKQTDWFKGWFLGSFEPSAFKTNTCEACFKKHKKGEKWPVHYHKIATEINYLIHGKMTIQNIEFNAGDVFVIEPNEIANPEFIEDCELIVVKIPSVPNDKYEVV